MLIDAEGLVERPGPGRVSIRIRDDRVESVSVDACLLDPEALPWLADAIRAAHDEAIASDVLAPHPDQPADPHRDALLERLRAYTDDALRDLEPCAAAPCLEGVTTIDDGPVHLHYLIGSLATVEVDPTACDLTPDEVACHVRWALERGMALIDDPEDGSITELEDLVEVLYPAHGT